MTSRIYLDNSATTPLDPRVRVAMEPFLGAAFGNPSSLHREGKKAREAVDTARAQVASLMGASPSEVIFTGSGTEADNLAVLGSCVKNEPAHIITTVLEHAAILETCRFLKTRGAKIDYLPVDSKGIVEPENLRKILRPETRLVSVMTASNIIGTIQPVESLAKITKEHGSLFHTDAVQACGKIPINVSTTPFDLVSLSAHKLHGPKGIGALYIRDGVHLDPIVFGGGQERGLRSATENVAGIVGFGVAAELAQKELAAEAARLREFRQQILHDPRLDSCGTFLIGHAENRLPGHLCLGFHGLEHEMLKLSLLLDEEGVAVSTGSACSSNHSGSTFNILSEMGFDEARSQGLLRVTLGRFTTAEDVARFIHILSAAVAKLRRRHYATNSGFASSVVSGKSQGA